MKGYKIFNDDWKCRGFQYRVGETATTDEELIMCRSGLHFCIDAITCLKYYSLDRHNKYAEVEATGRTLEQGNKRVTDALQIVRELSYDEFKQLITGDVVDKTNGTVRIITTYDKGVVTHQAILCYSEVSIVSIENRGGDGQRHGVYQQYYPTGILKLEELYAAGRLHGCSRRWSPDGLLQTEVIYDKGERMSDASSSSSGNRPSGI